MVTIVHINITLISIIYLNISKAYNKNSIWEEIKLFIYYKLI